MAMGGVYPDVVNAQCGDNGDGTFSNPVFWADVPDPDVIRVGDDFYMVSTTMHLVQERRSCTQKIWSTGKS